MAVRLPAYNDVSFGVLSFLFRLHLLPFHFVFRWLLAYKAFVTRHVLFRCAAELDDDFFSLSPHLSHDTALHHFFLWGLSEHRRSGRFIKW